MNQDEEQRYFLRGYFLRAIQTRYIAPIDVRGSRIIASDGDGNRIFISVDSSLDFIENHMTAARALINKMGWTWDKLHCAKLGNTFIWTS